MKSVNWKDIVEAVGVLAIVASLVFVGLQIKQDQVIARATLGSETAERIEPIWLMLADADFARTYAKMLDHPNDLSVDEMIQVDGFLSQLLNVMERECYLVQQGVFAECENVIKRIVRRYFGSRYAQSWWSQFKPPVGDAYPLPKWIDAEIQQLDEQAVRDSLRKVSAGL